MSAEAKKAFEEFQWQNKGFLDPLESRTLYFMADKCLPKDPFVYYAGDNYGATIYGVSTTSFREGRIRLEKRGIIKCIQESAFRRNNKRYLLVGLQPEGAKGISLPAPLETQKVEVETAKGISEGISLHPEWSKSVSSMKREKVKSEGEQFFNDLMKLIPDYYAEISFRSNLEELFNDLKETFEVELVANYLIQKKIGLHNSKGFLYNPFVKALQDLLEAPERAIEDFLRSKQRSAQVVTEQALEEPRVTPEQIAKLRPPNLASKPRAKGEQSEE